MNPLIDVFIENLKWIAAGGLDLQRQFEDLREQTELGLIDPVAAEQMAEELLAQAYAIEIGLINDKSIKEEIRRQKER